MKWSSDGIETEDFDSMISAYYDAFVASSPEFSDISFVRFEASKEYEQFYASAQIDLSQQALSAETFKKTQEYIRDTALEIKSSPTVDNAIPENIFNEFGYEASVKPMIEAEAGNVSIAIDYEPEEAENKEIAIFLMNNCVVGGVISLGDISEKATLSNGQQFEYRWTTGKPIPIKFKLTITISRNATSAVDDVQTIIEKFTSNFNERYKMGWDIEPERYYEVLNDAPYASNIATVYSLDDGTTWLDTPIQSVFDSKYSPTIDSVDVILVE